MMSINLDSVTDESNGIPECWHIDVNGKSSPEVFQKHFGLPRRLRNDKKILEMNIVRRRRLSSFMWCLLHYRNLSLPMMLTGDASTSPEAHAMTRYDEGWHLRNDEDLIHVAKLDAKDLKLKMVDLLAQKNDKAYKLQQVKVQAIANWANITMDRDYAAMCKCVIDTWLRARDNLANWDHLDGEAKQLLAEVIFCGFTFFGKTALEDVAAIEPGIFTYYRTFLGLPLLSNNMAVVVPVNAEPPYEPVELSTTKVPGDRSAPTAMLAEMAQSAIDNKPVAGKSDAQAAKSVQAQVQAGVSIAPYIYSTEAGPISLQELYAIIGKISHQAQAAKDVGLEPAQLIGELLDQHLQRLTLLNA